MNLKIIILNLSILIINLNILIISLKILILNIKILITIERLIDLKNQLFSNRNEMTSRDRQCEHHINQYIESQYRVANARKQQQEQKQRQIQIVKNRKMVQQQRIQFERLKLQSQIIDQRIRQQHLQIAALDQQELKYDAEVQQLKKILKKSQQQYAQWQSKACKQQEQLVKLKQKGRIISQIKEINYKALQQEKGNVRVYCRICPYKETETGSGKIQYQITQNCLEIFKSPSQSLRTTFRVHPVVFIKKSFYFEKIFREYASQNQIFEELTEFVQSFMEGKQVCIFAYGQTGSGKTFTMNGDVTDKNGSKRGFIPRSLQSIFNQVQNREKKGYNSKIFISSYQIYNDKINDLLKGREGDKISKQQQYEYVNKSPLKPFPVGNSKKIIPKSLSKPFPASKSKQIISKSRSKPFSASNSNKIIPITAEIIKQQGGNRSKKDLNCSYQIKDYGEGLEALKKALSRRKTGSTNMNNQSSRSHFIFQVTMRTKYEKNPISRLVLIDLAGSQRIKNSQVNKDLITESKSINSSLTELGRVMRLMKNSQNISFRNSKLTEILEQYLKKDGKAVMFVNMSSQLNDLDQTMNSLKFAEEVRESKIVSISKQEVLLLQKYEINDYINIVLCFLRCFSSCINYFAWLNYFTSVIWFQNIYFQFLKVQKNINKRQEIQNGIFRENTRR